MSDLSHRLGLALTDLLTEAPDLEAAAVVSFDGLPMASALPDGMDEDRVAAMSAALLSLGEKAAYGLGRGDLSQVYVEGESGTVFLVSAEDEAVLVAVAAKGAKAGLMLYEVRHAAERIGMLLSRPRTLESVPDLSAADEPPVLKPVREEPAAVKVPAPAPAPAPESQPVALVVPVPDHVPAQPSWSDGSAAIFRPGGVRFAETPTRERHGAESSPQGWPTYGVVTSVSSADRGDR